MLNTISAAFTCDERGCRRGIVVHARGGSFAEQLFDRGWHQMLGPLVDDGFPGPLEHYCPDHAHYAPPRLEPTA